MRYTSSVAVFCQDLKGPRKTFPAKIILRLILTWIYLYVCVNMMKIIDKQRKIFPSIFLTYKQEKRGSTRPLPGVGTHC